jgi:TP901 family phage tail tape measure protein
VASAGVVSVALRMMGASQFASAAAQAKNSLSTLGRGAATAAAQMQKAQAGLMAVTRAGAMMAAGGAATTYAMLRAGKASGEFSKALALVGKISTSTAEDLKAQEKAAMEAGIATQFSPLEAAKGMKVLAQAGVSARGQIELLIPVLDLAAAGEISVAEAASTTNRILGIYGKTTADAARVNDILLGTTTMLDISMQQMADSVGKTAGKTKLLGQTFETTALMLGLGHAALGDVNLASTANSAALARIMTNQKAKNHLDRLGIAITDKKTNKERQIIDILTDLQGALKGVETETANKIKVETLGIRGMGAYAAVAAATAEVMRDGEAVTLRGADAIEELRRRQSALVGTNAAFREAIKSTFSGKITYMMGSFDTLIINIGKSMEKVFGPIVDAATYGLNVMIAVVRALPDGFRTTMAAVVLFGAVTVAAIGTALVAFGSLGIMIAGIGAGITALPAVLAAAKAAIVAFASGTTAAIAPLLPAILAVSAAILSVGLVVGLLYEYNRKGLMDISGSWNAFLDFISDAISTAVKFWSDQWSLFMDSIFKSSSVGMQKVIKFMNLGLNKVMHMIGGLVDTYGEFLFALGYEQEAAALRGLRDDLKGFDADIAALARQVTEEFIDPALKSAERVATQALDLGKEIANNTLEGFGEALDGLGHLFSDLLSPVEEVAASVGEKIRDQMKKMVEEQAAGRKLPGGGGAGAGFDMDAYANRMRAQNQREVQARQKQRAQEQQTRVTGGLGAFQAGMSGNLGGLVSGIATAVGSAFGPVGSAVAGFADSLIGATEEGKVFKDILGGLFGELVKGLGPILNLFSMLITELRPFFQILGMVVETLGLAEPVFVILSKALGAVALIVMNLGMAFRWLWTTLLELLDALPFVDYTEEIAELQAAQAEARAERDDLIDRLTGIDNWEDQRARRERELAAATREATSAMLNVPSGYKVARAGFNAEVPVMDDFLMRPGEGAVEFSPDDTIIGVKETGGLGGPTIVIQNLSVNANNPTSFVRQLMNVVGSDTAAGGVALGGAFQGRP